MSPFFSKKQIKNKMCHDIFVEERSSHMMCKRKLPCGLHCFRMKNKLYTHGINKYILENFTYFLLIYDIFDYSLCFGTLKNISLIILLFLSNY